MATPLYNLAAFRLAWLFARLFPRWVSLNTAPLIAAGIDRRAPAGRNAIRENLRIATGRSGADLEQLCTTNIRNFSRMLSDYFYYSSRSPRAGEALLGAWSGWEHFAAAVEAKRGIILVTGHLGNWELGGVLLTQRGIPVTVITLDEPSSALTEWREGYRRRVGIKTIAVGPGRDFAFVEMMQVLRRGECLAMLVDRPYEGTGAPVRLFGRETQFSTGPALLAQHTGAAVIPAFVTLMPNGRYQAQALPPVPMRAKGEPGGSVAENTQTIASVFESVIGDTPAQWYYYVPLWNSSPGP